MTLRDESGVVRVFQNGKINALSDMSPRNDTSAGKRKSTRLRDGAPWQKTTLVQAAWSAATRTKGTYFRAR